MNEERNRRKVRQGVVVSATNDKTIVVQIQERKPHRVYGKMITTTKKFHAHDEGNEAGVGDTPLQAEALASPRHRREGQVVS